MKRSDYAKRVAVVEGRAVGRVSTAADRTQHRAGAADRRVRRRARRTASPLPRSRTTVHHQLQCLCDSAAARGSLVGAAVPESASGLTAEQPHLRKVLTTPTVGSIVG
jgi:hypothetical protein